MSQASSSWSSRCSSPRAATASRSARTAGSASAASTSAMPASTRAISPSRRWTSRAGARRSGAASERRRRRRGAARGCRRGRGGRRRLRLVARAQQVGVAARAQHGAPVLDGERVGGDGVDQGAVVGHHHHGAVEGPERRLERLPALGVEVVGRLVQHQQVPAAGDQGHELQPPPLAARQPLHGGVGVGAREQEAAEQGPGLGLGEVARRQDGLDDGAVVAQAGALLGEVGDLHAVAHADPAALGRAPPDERLDQARLAGAVRARPRPGAGRAPA